MTLLYIFLRRIRQNKRQFFNGGVLLMLIKMQWSVFEHGTRDFYEHVKNKVGT